MRLPTVAAVLMLASAGMAVAQTPSADAPVATAKGTSFPSTQQQIDAYLASPPPLERPARALGDGEAPLFEDDGRIHGEVSLSVGTGGYRSGSVAAVIPLPRDGTLALAYEHTKFGDGQYAYPAYSGASGTMSTLEACGPTPWTGAGTAQPQWIGRPRDPSSSCPMR